MTGSQISLIIFTLSIIAFFFVVSFIIVSKITQKKRQIENRVEKILPKEKSILSEIRDGRQEDKPGHKRGLIRNKKFLDLIYNELTLADIKLKPEEFGVLWLVLTFLPSGLLGLFTGKMLSAVTLAAIGAALPAFIISSRKKSALLLLKYSLAMR